MNFLNPFKELNPAHRRDVVRQKLVEAQVKQRFDELSKQYRLMLEDARYDAIRGELESTLGEQLQALIAKARSCACCAPLAVRVDALNDILARPLAQVWMETQRTRMEEIAEPIADEF